MAIEPVLIIFVILLWIFIVSAISEWLWNMTMPELFGLKVINYWQSFRLLIIASILTGGSLIDLDFTR